MQLESCGGAPTSLHQPPCTLPSRGWQWLFLLEGVPSFILGLLVFTLLPGSISAARFLTPIEKEALEAEFARDRVPGPLGCDMKGALVLLRLMAGNIRLWGAFVCGALSSVSSHTYLTYTPIIISNLLRWVKGLWVQVPGQTGFLRGLLRALHRTQNMIGGGM